MRSFLFGVSLVAVGLISLISVRPILAADLPKDSAQSDMTRNHKLKVKVTLKLKQKPLKEIFDEINAQVIDNKFEGKKMSKLRIVYDTGISSNTRMDVDVKDVTLAEALDSLLKQNDYGYIVMIGKKDEQNDGAIKIVKGDNRGYPTGSEPKKDEPKKK